MGPWGRGLPCLNCNLISIETQYYLNSTICETCSFLESKITSCVQTEKNIVYRKGSTLFALLEVRRED